MWRIDVRVTQLSNSDQRCWIYLVYLFNGYVFYLYFYTVILLFKLCMFSEVSSFLSQR